MAAYLRFYQLVASPFDGLVTQHGMVLGTPALKSALAQVKQGLDEGAPRICLSGSEGLGKTSFGRALPKLLADDAQVAVSLDPNRSWEEIRARACKRFGLETGAMSRKSLQVARQTGKRLVIVFDQAERLSHETLDHLDILLQYKDDEGGQLVHCVMLANLDAAATGVEVPLLWWLDKYTTLQLQFSPIPIEGVRHYVEKHLSKAGWAGGELFTEGAIRSIHAYTGGAPGSINRLCERILIEGSGRGITSIKESFIDQLCGDELAAPEGVAEPEVDAVSPDREANEPGPDLSMSGFASGPSAQEMLDDSSAPNDRLDEPDFDIRPEPETSAAREEDLASLLVTEDSPEPLLTASENPETADQPSESLELENEPETDEHPDLYERKGPPTKLVGISRPAAGAAPIARPRRRTGGWVIAALVVATLGWFAYAQFQAPGPLIESAGGQIQKVIEKTSRLGTPGSHSAGEPERAGLATAEQGSEPASPSPEADARGNNSLPRSLIDRADELAADPNANLVPVPSIALDPEGRTGEGSKNESEVETAGLGVNRPASPPAPAPPQTTSASRPKAAASEIPSEMIVLNEYTAIPEAASVEPKLPTPEAAEPADESAEAANESDLETAGRSGEGPPPARIDATPRTEATPAEPALPRPDATEPEPANPIDAEPKRAPGAPADEEATAPPVPEAIPTPDA